MYICIRIYNIYYNCKEKGSKGLLLPSILLYKGVKDHCDCTVKQAMLSNYCCTVLLYMNQAVKDNYICTI